MTNESRCLKTGEILESRFNGEFVSKNHTQWKVEESYKSRVICRDVDDSSKHYVFTLRSNGKYVAKYRPTKKCYQLHYPECQLCCARHRPATLVCGHSLCERCLIATSVKNKRECPYCRAPFMIASSLFPKYIEQTELEMRKHREDCESYEERLLLHRKQERLLVRLAAAWDEIYQLRDNADLLVERMVEMTSSLKNVIVPVLIAQEQT